MSYKCIEKGCEKISAVPTVIPSNWAAGKSLKRCPACGGRVKEIEEEKVYPMWGGGNDVA